ncbi:serpin-ZXA-like [Lolium rigidum]|uniref:serpin-ZXA-like n=1 Tax=Lolium rigidum TaxID=89674 RepID=UPI001F5CE6AA|nr:serpin-ZXA-like [Lolium rigidum]
MAAAVRDGQTALALRLAKQLAPASGNFSAKGNVAFSPASIHAALSLVAAGARGATLDQLLAFLGAPSSPGLADFGRRVVHQVLGDRAASGGPSVLFSGGIWVEASRGGISRAFRDVADQCYNSVARAVSFADKPVEVAEAINSWVRTATNNLIDSIVSASDITPNTDLVLANAVYFKAKWLHPFQARRTGPGTFHRLDGTRVDAQFMTQTMYGVHYASSVDGFKVLKLPYKHGSASDDTHYSMYIFLPDDHQGIAGMVDAITAGPEYLYSVLPKTANKSAVLTVRLPKFETSFDWDLGDDLRLMGLLLPFSPESADLRGIFHKNHSTYLSKVLHKAVVKVDEDGTEAAAATVTLMKGAGRKPPTQFVADHPFTFFIMEERSGVIVFAGHVLDPTNRSASKL